MIHLMIADQRVQTFGQDDRKRLDLRQPGEVVRQVQGDPLPRTRRPVPGLIVHRWSIT